MTCLQANVTDQRMWDTDRLLTRQPLEAGRRSHEMDGRMDETGRPLRGLHELFNGQ